MQKWKVPANSLRKELDNPATINRIQSFIHSEDKRGPGRKSRAVTGGYWSLDSSTKTWKLFDVYMWDLELGLRLGKITTHRTPKLQLALSRHHQIPINTTCRTVEKRRSLWTRQFANWYHKKISNPYNRSMVGGWTTSKINFLPLTVSRAPSASGFPVITKLPIQARKLAPRVCRWKLIVRELGGSFRDCRIGMTAILESRYT